MSDILFVHNNFPGQFGFLVEALTARGDRCAAIGSIQAPGMPGVPLLRWRPSRGSTQGIFIPAARTETSLIHGEAAARCAAEYKKRGFEPDVIVAHPGWGETIFIRKFFPKARMVNYAEYYHGDGAVMGFDPEFGAPGMEEQFRDHARNAPLALSYLDADMLVCATAFQRDLLPMALHGVTRIIHEGIDTARIKPDAAATFTLPDGRMLGRGTPVVTFINRHFEPLRGFHIFMRALPAILAAVPEAQIVLIGDAADNGYGRAAPEGRTWKDHYLAELGERLDRSRIHFTGRLRHDRMLDALKASSAHVYYTYPFALSWSMLEAMSCGALIVGSDTAPVREAIEPGVSGILNDFFDVEALADAVIDACRNPATHQEMRRAARSAVIAKYDRATRCLPDWLALIDDARDLVR